MMTEIEAKKEIEHNVFCNTDNFEMTISKECYKTIIKALEKQEKIKETFTHFVLYGNKFELFNDCISALSEIRTILEE